MGLSASWVAAQTAAGGDANGIKLTISPVPISISIAPGQSFSQVVEVKNAGSKVETLTPGLLSFSVNKDTGATILKLPTKDDEFVPWVHFSNPSLTLKPQEWGKVTMTINVPDTAAYGYYFAVRWSRPAEADSLNNGSTSLIGSVAQLVLLEVPAPGTKREIKVNSFKTDQKWYEFLPVTFTASLQNTGNIHAAPTGNIFIENGRHNQVDSLRINKEKGVILPGSSRSFSSTWSNGFPLYQYKMVDDKVVLNKEGQAQKQLVWKLSHADWWRFGRYNASLLMAYNRDGQDIPLTAQVSFWIIPWRLILLLIAIPTVPAILVYVLMSRRLKKAARQ